MKRFVKRKARAAAHFAAWWTLCLPAFIVTFIICGISGTGTQAPEIVLGWMRYNEQQAWSHWEG